MQTCKKKSITDARGCQRELLAVVSFVVSSHLVHCEGGVGPGRAPSADCTVCANEAVRASNLCKAKWCGVLSDVHFGRAYPLRKLTAKRPWKWFFGRRLAFPFESFPSLFSVVIPSFSWDICRCVFIEKLGDRTPPKAKQNSGDQIGDGCPNSPAESFQKIWRVFCKALFGDRGSYTSILSGLPWRWSSLKSPFLLRVSQENFDYEIASEMRSPFLADQDFMGKYPQLFLIWMVISPVQTMT